MCKICNTQRIFIIILCLGQISELYVPSQIVSVDDADKNTRDSLTNQNKIFGEEYISESILVQDLIYSFQGIEGKVLKLDSNCGFQMDPMMNIDRSRKQATLRLSELGYLYNIIQKGLERISAAASGQVADSFVAAMHSELSEYYRFIAIIQEEVNRYRLKFNVKMHSILTYFNLL